MIINLNGKFVPKEKAVVSVFDHGLLYGDGVFEGIRSYNGRVFKLDEHLARHSSWSKRMSIVSRIRYFTRSGQGAKGFVIPETAAANPGTVIIVELILRH